MGRERLRPEQNNNLTNRSQLVKLLLLLARTKRAAKKGGMQARHPKQCGKLDKLGIFSVRKNCCKKRDYEKMG